MCFQSSAARPQGPDRFRCRTRAHFPQIRAAHGFSRLRLDRAGQAEGREDCFEIVKIAQKPRRTRVMWGQPPSCPWLSSRVFLDLPLLYNYPTSIFSPTNCLSLSSDPTSSNEFVSTALPFSTLVMTYEQPNQCASAN